MIALATMVGLMARVLLSLTGCKRLTIGRTALETHGVARRTGKKLRLALVKNSHSAPQHACAKAVKTMVKRGWPSACCFPGYGTLPRDLSVCSTGVEYRGISVVRGHSSARGGWPRPGGFDSHVPSRRVSRNAGD